MGVVYHLELKLTKLQLCFCSFFEGRRIDQNPAIVFSLYSSRACRFSHHRIVCCSKSCGVLLAQRVIFVIIITPCYPLGSFQAGKFNASYIPTSLFCKAKGQENTVSIDLVELPWLKRSQELTPLNHNLFRLLASRSCLGWKSSQHQCQKPYSLGPHLLYGANYLYFSKRQPCGCALAGRVQPSNLDTYSNAEAISGPNSALKSASLPTSVLLAISSRLSSRAFSQ